MIKAIDTYYNGNYYRSRLEARWAVFFDIAQIHFNYESEGYEMGNGVRYLPDFYLPRFSLLTEGLHIEIKPDMGGRLNKQLLDHPDYYKWIEFSKSKDLLVIFGQPHCKSHFYFSFRTHDHPGSYIDANFYFDNKEGIGWRLWWGDGNDYHDLLEPIVNKANRVRFENQANVSSIPASRWKLPSDDDDIW